LRALKVWLAALALVILVVFALVTYLKVVKEPNIRDPEFVQGRAEEFLAVASGDLFPSDVYTLVELKGPAGSEKDWLLLTIARFNPNWTPGTGAGGLIAMGRLEKGGWRFLLPTNSEFDSWLEQLPATLLSDKLKRSFQTASSYPEELSSAMPLLASSPQFSNQEVELYLPYPEKRGYKITTLPGDGDHLEKWNAYYALDFDMPQGADIAASAGGEVIAIKDDSQKGGYSEAYKDDANYVVIKIAPNQTIRYMHIAYRSATSAGLKLHDKVEVGQIIGRADSSGWACGAHLHIVLEKLCGNRVCDSLPLDFVEFGQGDPRYGKEYVSQNKSPEKRLAEAEKRRKEQERAEIEQITDAVEKFHTIYSCYRVKDCDESSLIRSWITDGLFAEMFESFCLFCPSKADTATEISEELLPFTAPKTEQTTVRSKEVWELEIRGKKRTDYTVVAHFLVKGNGVWKVDGWEIECGYVIDEDGDIIHKEHLEGCLWQPPEESTSGSTQ